MPVTSKNYTVTPYVAPVKGLNYAAAGTLLKPDYMTECSNVYMDRYNTVKKREGYATLGEGLPLAGGIVVGLDQLFLTNGNDHLMAVTEDAFYTYNATSTYWESIMPTLVSNCNAAWDQKTNVTASADTTDKAEGTASAKLIIAAAFTTGIAATDVVTSVDCTDADALYFVIKSDVATTAGQLQVGVSETVTMGGTPTWVDVPALVADTWTMCQVDDTFTGYDKVISVGLNVVTNIGAQTVHVDDIRAITKLTGDADNLFFMDTMDDKMIMTNYTDSIKTWAGSTGDIAALAGTPPKAKFLKKYKDYLVLGFVNDGTAYPQRVQWSDTGDEETWSGGNTGSEDLMEGVDFVMGMDLLGDKLIVFKERSIYVGYLVATDAIFQFDLKVEGIGLSAPNCFVNLGDEIIFLGWDNVYAFNGINVEAIGDEIKDEMFNLINPAKLDRCHVHQVEEYTEIHFFIPGSTDDYPELEFVYNYTKKAWTRNTRTHITSTGYYTKQATTTWNAAVGTWDAQTARWDDRSFLASSPVNLLGNTTGYVFQWDYTVSNDNAVAVDAYFDTVDFVMDQWDTQKYFMRLDFVGKGDTVDVYYSINEGSTWTQIGSSVTLGTDFTTHKNDFRLSAEKVRFRWRNDTASETFQIRMYTLYVTPGGRLL